MNTLLYVSIVSLFSLVFLIQIRIVEAGRRVTNNHNHNHHNTIFQCDPPQNTENALYNAVSRSFYSCYFDVCKEKQYYLCPVSDYTCGYDKCIKQMIEEKENPRENLPARFAAIKLALDDNVPCSAQNLLTNYLSEISEHELNIIQTVEKLMKDDEDARKKYLHILDVKRQEEKKIQEEQKRLEDIEAYNKRYEENWLSRWIVSTIFLFIISTCIIPERNQVLICKYIKKWLYSPKRYGDNMCPCCLGKTYYYTDCGHALCKPCFGALQGNKICPKCRTSITEVSR